MFYCGELFDGMCFIKTVSILHPSSRVISAFAVELSLLTFKIELISKGHSFFNFSRKGAGKFFASSQDSIRFLKIASSTCLSRKGGSEERTDLIKERTILFVLEKRLFFERRLHFRKVCF